MADSSIDTGNISSVSSEAFDNNAFDSLEIPGFADPPKEEKEEVAAAAEEVEEPKADEVEAEDAPVAATPDTPQAKPLHFRVGDKEVPLTEDATIPWKVDGQTQTVTVKDLLSNYAGKVAWDKRLNDVAQQRKTMAAEKIKLDTERHQQKTMVSKFVEHAKAGKREAAVQTLLEMTGLNIDAREFNKNLRDSYLAHAQQLAQMTDAERAAYEINEEREQLRAQKEAWQQQRDGEQAQSALKTRVVNAIQESGVEAEKFAETSSWLAERIAAQGGDPTQLTPESVVSHIRMTNAYEVAREAVAAVEPDLVRDGTVTDDAKWDKLAQLAMANPDISRDEFIKMYREVREAKSGKSVAKKIAKAPVATVATAGTKTKPKPAPKSNDYSTITAEDLKF